MLDHGLIICLAPPPLLRQQAPKERRNQDETVFIDNAKGEKGKVYINSITPPDIRIDYISVITHGSQSMYLVVFPLARFSYFLIRRIEREFFRLVNSRKKYPLVH